MRTAELRRVWLRFDRSTAYGCAARGVPFDLAACHEAWLEWCAVQAANGIPAPPVPIGL